MLRTLVVVSTLLVVPSMPAAAQLRVDYDRHADFSRYRTFEVSVGPLVGTNGEVDEQNTLAENRLRRAVSSELAARGLEATDAGADLLVRVSGRDTERSEIVSSGLNNHALYWVRPYGYGRWGYWRSRGYWVGRPYNDFWTRRYVEGSLTVDAIDRSTGRLVYRAQVSDEVGKDLDKQVMKTVDRAFKKFPLKQLEH